MFSKKTSVAAPRFQRPEPEPIVVPTGMATYLQVATQLGYENAATKRGELIDLLMREEIPIYDLARVQKYMDSLVGHDTGDSAQNGQMMWSWRPLRVSDRLKREWKPWEVGGFQWSVQYNEAVPVAALKHATTISTAFPEVKFVVASIHLRERWNAGGDPFLAAFFDLSGFHVVPFAVWDEPGF